MYCAVLYALRGKKGDVTMSKAKMDTRTFYAREDMRFVRHTGVVVDANADKGEFYVYHNGNSVKRNPATFVGIWHRFMVWHSPKDGWCVTHHQTGYTWTGYANREIALRKTCDMSHDIAYADTIDDDDWYAFWRDMCGLRTYRNEGNEPRSISVQYLWKHGYIQ